jgi:hypothetical protein
MMSQKACYHLMLVFLDLHKTTTMPPSLSSFCVGFSWFAEDDNELEGSWLSLGFFFLHFFLQLQKTTTS